MSNERLLVIACAICVTCVLGMQLVAATAWTADVANAGPSVVVLQLSGDPDTQWATDDLLTRLRMFISDDPFFANRLNLIRTSDPRAAMSLDADIVIYVSHGGPLGIVTGKHLTFWEDMAEIVTESRAKMHLFAACASRNLVQYGNDDSGRYVYTVPGVRPAEVTNVEITSSVMLAVGLKPEMVEQYRTEQLTLAKELVQSATSVHLMDFEEIIIDQIEYIDDTYTDTYTSTHMVERSSDWVLLYGPTGFNALPAELKAVIAQYYRTYWYSYGGNLVPELRQLLGLSVNYTRNYYQEAWWVPEEPPLGEPLGEGEYSDVYIQIAPPGYWEWGPLTFCGGTYSGIVRYSGDGSLYDEVWVNVTASGSVLNDVDSISLAQVGAGGQYVSKQKVDGVWSDPVVGRNPGRSGGLWTEPAVRNDYEYDSTWPVVPGLTATTGTIGCTGDYLYVSSITSGSGWRGPSFMKTLPSYFSLGDLGAFSANLSLVHGGVAARESKTYVNLYDSNKKLALSLSVEDTASTAQSVVFRARYYDETGGYKEDYSATLSGDQSGIVTLRYDPVQGLFADVPGKSEKLLYVYSQLNLQRLIKYVVVQSYRGGTYAEHDERVYNVRLSYAYSEYTVFHDQCNDLYELHKDLTFPFGMPAEGVLEVPSGQSYMKWSSIVTGTGWHGPQNVHVLDRPFRLYQLTEFSVVGELVQSASTMGKAYVGLFDENRLPVMVMYWGDLYTSSQKGFFYTLSYTQDGSTDYQFSGYITTTFTRTGKMWWDPWQGGDGAIYSTINGVAGDVPLAECDNCSRVIKYVVTYGARLDSNALIQMRVHDISVLTDLDAVNPLDPEPDAPVEADGTDYGDAEYVQGKLPPPDKEALIGEVNNWWTGPWPRLHTKVDYVAADGASVKYHVSNDLLGCLVVEEDMDIETNRAEDPLESPEFLARVAQVYFDTLWANKEIEIAVTVSDALMSIVCAGLEKHPAWWPAAIALGVAWTALFVVVTYATISGVCRQTEDPFERYWSIVLIGITICFGWLVASSLSPIGQYVAAGKGSMSDWFMTKTTASLTWILWKFLCTLIIFVMAGIVLTLTLAGCL